MAQKQEARDSGTVEPQVSEAERKARKNLERGLKAMKAAGWAIAEKKPLPRLNPHVLYELTGGKRGEPIPDGVPPGPAILGAHQVHHHAAERLAELYLEETGLGAKQARGALYLETFAAGVEGRELLVLDRLHKTEGAELHRAEKQLKGLATILHALTLGSAWQGEQPTPGVLKKYHLTKEDLRAARQLVDEKLATEKRIVLDFGTQAGLHLELPTARKAKATYERLADKAAATEEDYEKVLAEVARMWGGQPSLLAWLRERGQETYFDAVRAVLERKGREAAEERAKKAEERVAELEATAAVAPLLELGDRTLIPRPLADVFRDSSRLIQRKLDRITQGDLFPVGDTLEALREAEVTISGRQLAHLNTPKVRALCATLRAMSSPSDDGQAFRYDGLRLSFDLFCQAAEVDTKHTKAKRDLLHGLDGLTREEVFASLTFSEDGKRKMWGGRTRIVSAILEWEDNQEAARLWANRKPGEPWDGPLPSAIILGLPPMMRYVFNALCLGGDVLARLDSGAKKLRGKLLHLDFALFLEIAQTQQQRSKGPDGQPLSYVNRDAFILEHFGERRVQQDKAKGRYSKRRGAAGQYLHSAEVLIEAELIRPGWSHQQETRSGIRDVFALVPGVVLHRPMGAPPQEELLPAANQVGGAEKPA